jgi:hypothetical protein
VIPKKITAYGKDPALSVEEVSVFSGIFKKFVPGPSLIS